MSSISRLLSPLTFARGPSWSNRFMLAPLTNKQSEDNGVLSNDEYQWLTYRATGGFGMVMTCAAHVQAIGQGFPGQLGVFSDIHNEGLARLAAGIREEGAVSSVQIHHAGIRAPRELIGTSPKGPSSHEVTGAVAFTLPEVKELIEDFIVAAERAQIAGFDGVEIHGAHGYVLCGFLSVTENLRDDEYGGSLENRSRIIREIVTGIRSRTRPSFQVGLRISPERYGLNLADQLELTRSFLLGGELDYIDVSLWDCFKEPVDPAFAGQSLLQLFANLPRGDTRLGVAGKLYSAADCERVLDAGIDFCVVGRAGIIHHDFPKQVALDPSFRALPLPVTAEHLRSQRLGSKFIEYLRNWPGFVAEDKA